MPERPFAGYLNFTRNSMRLHRAECGLVKREQSSLFGAWDEFDTLSHAVESAESNGFEVSYCGACKPQGDIRIYVAEQLIGGRSPNDVASDLINNSGLEIEQAAKLVDEVSAALVAEARRAAPLRRQRGRRRMNSDSYHWRNIGVALGTGILALAGSALVGFILGIVPGLLLGLMDWHEPGAIVIAVIWGVGYLIQRSKNFGDANWVTLLIGASGGLGVWSSVWLFGKITS